MDPFHKTVMMPLTVISINVFYISIIFFMYVHLKHYTCIILPLHQIKIVKTNAASMGGMVIWHCSLLWLPLAVSLNFFTIVFSFAIWANGNAKKYVTLEHKTSLGYICSNSQKYIVWVKIIYFSFMPKIIRILRSCSMKIFCTFLTVNI